MKQHKQGKCRILLSFKRRAIFLELIVLAIKTDGHQKHKVQTSRPQKNFLKLEGSMSQPTAVKTVAFCQSFVVAVIER